jgi:hypothetical protein
MRGKMLNKDEGEAGIGRKVLQQARERLEAPGRRTHTHYGKNPRPRHRIGFFHHDKTLSLRGRLYHELAHPMESTEAAEGIGDAPARMPVPIGIVAPGHGLIGVGIVEQR